MFKTEMETPPSVPEDLDSLGWLLLVPKIKHFIIISHSKIQTSRKTNKLQEHLIQYEKEASRVHGQQV